MALNTAGQTRTSSDKQDSPGAAMGKVVFGHALIATASRLGALAAAVHLAVFEVALEAGFVWQCQNPPAVPSKGLHFALIFRSVSH